MIATLINTTELQYIPRHRLEELSVWLDSNLENLYQEMEERDDPFAPPPEEFSELAEGEEPLSQLAQWLSSSGHLIATLAGLNDIVKEEIVRKTAH